MGWKFRKSIKIAPGVKVNLSRRGVGMSAGTKGFRVGVNSKGKAYSRTSIPGTGIYSYNEYGGKQPANKSRNTNPQIKIWEIVIVLLAGISLIAYDSYLLGGFFIIAGVLLCILKKIL